MSRGPHGNRHEEGVLTSSKVDQVGSTDTPLKGHLVQDAAGGDHLEVVPASGALVRQDDGPITATIGEAVVKGQAEGLRCEVCAKTFVVDEPVFEFLSDLSPLFRAVGIGAAEGVAGLESGKKDAINT